MQSPVLQMVAWPGHKYARNDLDVWEDSKWKKIFQCAQTAKINSILVFINLAHILLVQCLINNTAVEAAVTQIPCKYHLQFWLHYHHPCRSSTSEHMVRGLLLLLPPVYLIFILESPI